MTAQSWHLQKIDTIWGPVMELQYDEFYIEFELRAKIVSDMMTSLNGNIFRVTGLLCGEFTGPLWIPRTNASDAELWCFLSSVPE